MAGSPQKKARRERALKLLEDPATYAGILEQVSAGTTVVTACMERDIPRHIFSQWVEEDGSRAAALAAAQASREQCMRDMVSATLAELCQADITAAFYADGSLRPLSEIPANVRAAISGLEVQEIYEGSGDNRRVVGVTKRLRFWDKTRALELMGRSLKMLTDRHEVGVERPSLADLLSEDYPPRKLPAVLKPALDEGSE